MNQIESRPIEDWLKELPKGYRELALKNYDPDFTLSTESSCMANAIDGAFCWDESPEGLDFWHKLHGFYNGDNDALPPLPTLVKAKQKYDFINPDHYKKSSKEVYEMMIDIWGEEAFIIHCEMTAFKYRMRAGTKPDQPIERDLMKAKWYEAKAESYREQLKNNNND